MLGRKREHFPDKWYVQTFTGSGNLGGKTELKIRNKRKSEIKI